MTKIGDKVRFLNAVGGGIVTRIEGKIAYVDEDGFETPVLLKEVVTVDTDRFYGRDAKPAPAPRPTSPVTSPKAVATPSPAAVAQERHSMPEPDAAAPIIPVEEVPGGDRLNVVLGYEPRDIKKLNTTVYDAYLVNDSNYYLSVAYMTRANDDREWTLRYAGEIEPNIQEYLGEVSREDIPDMERLAVQIVAYKRDKGFALKAPVAIERPLDNTKFFKLHCFQRNTYFDNPVIAIDIVKNDVAQRPVYVDGPALEEGIKQKSRDVKRSERRPRISQPRPNSVYEVDLHIGALLDSTAGLSNSDMLELQLREVRRAMDAHIREKGSKIVFIHGKGEGVLRKAVLQLLAREYKHCQTQDASFREYGFGATQVTI